MGFEDWIAEPLNWVFAVIALATVVSGFRVVTSPNVVHAALFLVAALAGTAALFLLLAAEFLAWVLVLVYIGAVIVLFLFGIMITRAPTGRDESNLDHKRRLPAALVSLALLALLLWGLISQWGDTTIDRITAGTPTTVLGEGLLGRFVFPFEVVGFVLLAALVGGITIARRDLSPAEEKEWESK
ncbi:MAG: NADH-quinone oxidoreductase subunit J [bacterium]|nr:NADH-quinone oxidoreductase subunit J [Acidimicrobiia bacterium]MCY4651229.1 NADH-quinone oxidoreductase subunit J [bacterium]